MGVFIWHEWARVVAVFASIYTAWAATWGILFRKFFWDFVDGTLSPTGIIPGKSAAPFVAVIVKVPVVQVLAFVLSIATFLFECPLPAIKRTTFYRSFGLRIALLLTQGFLASLFYQGTNGALYSAVAAFGYARAVMRHEKMKDEKPPMIGAQAA